jgi:arabinose-5-phosphate isomerase
VNKTDALVLANMIIQQERHALQSLADSLDDSFWTVARLISDCPGLIWVTGVGTSTSVGTRFAHILTDCGARSMFLAPSDGLHGHSAVMTPDDVLVCMSRGGESSTIVQMAQAAKRHGAIPIAFVHNTRSTLAHICQYVLPIQSDQDLELMTYVATTSTVAFSAMCDAVSAVVLEQKGYTLEQLGRAHPGGAVGQALAAQRKPTETKTE